MGIINRLFRKNPGCKFCGYYNHKSNDCRHDRNMHKVDMGDFRSDEGNGLWTPEERNCDNRCFLYLFATNQTTPEKYRSVTEEFKYLLKREK